jgi:hypothetical protein
MHLPTRIDVAVSADVLAAVMSVRRRVRLLPVVRETRVGRDPAALKLIHSPL